MDHIPSEHELSHFVTLIHTIMCFLKSGGDTLTGTDHHQLLKFATFGNPRETNSGYATGFPPIAPNIT